ncbi:glycine cleavage system protein H [Herbaspirillum huttiense]|uniref:glycine cleavage system protein H n=1 Tax=Herbaspirillum huttiense TaxID=863372 RepID=UPI001E44CED6|nr:hypothetical protein [Herbaspirillum huttiense]
MHIPDHLVYAETHEWVKLEDDGTLTIGITDFGQEQLGPLVYVDMPAVGKVLAKGAESGIVESNKTASDLHAPVDGGGGGGKRGGGGPCHCWRNPICDPHHCRNSC